MNYILLPDGPFLETKTIGINHWFLNQFATQNLVKI